LIRIKDRILRYFIINKRNIIIIVVFLVLPFIFFADTLKIGSVILGRGDIIHTLSIKQFILDAFKNFNMPLWNRYIYCGHPFISLSIFYPISLILELIFPLALAYNLGVLIHCSLAGIFMFMLLDEYKLKKLASFAGGIIFMFSGVMITYKSTLMSQTIAWFPLILMFLEKFRKSKRFELLILASIFYSISLYGHAQMFLYGSIVLFLFIIYYSFIYERNYFFLLANIIFIGAISINTYIIFDAASWINNSVRGIVDDRYTFFSTGSLNPKLLLNVFFPYIFGCKNPSASGIPHFLRWFGKEDSLGMINYLGISTIPLFIFGIFSRKKLKFFWLFIMTLSFFLILGRYTPLNKLVFQIPLFNMFRNPTRHWFEFGLAFSILCGFGFDYFIRLNRRNTKKILFDGIGFLSFIFSGFLFYYYLFQLKFKDKIIGFFIPALMPEYFDGTSISDIFEQSMKLTNYSIYIPLIILFITIGFLVLLLFKKSKVIYIILIILILLDLYSFGHFDEKNTKNIYIPEEKVEQSINLKFLRDENEMFRIYPVVEIPSEYIFYPNKNVYFHMEYVTGYGYGDRIFSYITNISELPYETSSNWKELVENNIILSMLNTKYIILPQMENNNKFLDSIVKYYWNDSGKPVLKDLISGVELKNSSIKYDENIIKISGESSVFKLYKVPINIKSNKDYIIAFDIKADNNLNNNIFFDFYGEDYDFPEQGFHIPYGEITEDYTRFEMIINSKDVPKNTDIYFRVYTTSGGRLWIEDLAINELKKYENYKVVYQDKEVFILENINCVPRFFAPENIIPVKNYKEAKKILWEYDVKWDCERFDPQTEALVEGWDVEKNNFNTEDVTIEHINYNNNGVSLDVKSGEDIFLVFSNTYYPGWNATIDGNKTNIYRTNGTIQGIYVPAGKHRIVFNYLPRLSWLYMGISISSFILVISMVLVLFFRRKKGNLQ